MAERCRDDKGVDGAYQSSMPAAGSLVDRIANLAVTIVPLALIAVAIQQSWGGLLVWQDVLIFFATLVPFGFGVTVGFHRLFTHRSFKTSRPMRFLLAVLGSMALEGPVIEWVAYHRRHHRYSDVEGDPHSPHVGYGEGFLGAVRGLFHAHVGWVLFSDEPAEEERYAPTCSPTRWSSSSTAPSSSGPWRVWRCLSGSAWR